MSPRRLETGVRNNNPSLQILKRLARALGVSVTGVAVMIRPEIRERFRRVVATAIERADREHQEHLARLRASGRHVEHRATAGRNHDAVMERRVRRRTK